MSEQEALKKRCRPIKAKDGSYFWYGVNIKRQENSLWGVWFNYRDKMSSDHKTLKECMEVIELYWKRKSKKHLRLVK
jgi:hypothetical protein